MEDMSDHIIPLADYCAENDIEDVDEFRTDVEPYLCIFKIGDVEYFSPDVHCAARQAEYDKLHPTKASRVTRVMSDEVMHLRKIKRLPIKIAETKFEIEKEETALANTKDLGLRFKIKKQLVNLRGLLAGLEASYAESVAFLEKFVNEDEGKELEV